jgi:hypothetical protein
MEFSYRVSEKDYLQAWKLRNKNLIGKTILFWVFILICLTLFWILASRQASSPPTQASEPHASSSAGQAGTLPASAPAPKRNSEPFLSPTRWAIYVAIPILVALLNFKKPLYRLYRKDPSMQGQFTLNLTSAAVAFQNTAGISSRVAWGLYDYWREGKDVLILSYKAGAYFIVNLANLSDPQRDELRGILTAALPKK